MVGALLNKVVTLFGISTSYSHTTSNDIRQLIRNIMNMKRIVQHLNSWNFIVTIFLLSSCNSSNNFGKKAIPYGEATQELIKMVDTNPELKSMLLASIEKAKQVNPDTNTNPLQSLDRYYEFASKAESSTPWAVVKTKQGTSTMEDIFKFLCQFYFIG